VHVVLDEDHGDPELVLDLEDVAGHVLGLLEVHAGDRLVEEQQLRFHGQGPAELDPLLDAVGQQPRRRAPVGGELEKVDDLLHGPAVLELLALGLAPPHRPGEEPGAHQVVAAEEEVVDHVEVDEQAQVLEGAADPQLRGAVGPLTHEVHAVEVDGALLRPVDGGEAVEDRGLAGPVGPDDAEQLARVDVEAHAGEGGDAAEAQCEVAHLEQRVPLLGPRRGRRRLDLGLVGGHGQDPQLFLRR
jgi:hypothetical protein